MASAKNESMKNADAKAGKAMDADAGNGTVKSAAGAASIQGQQEECASGKAPLYTAEEFCMYAQELFQARPECVRAALMECRAEQCTKAEAEKIVKAFLHKEVK